MNRLMKIILLKIHDFLSIFMMYAIALAEVFITNKLVAWYCHVHTQPLCTCWFILTGRQTKKKKKHSKNEIWNVCVPNSITAFCGYLQLLSKWHPPRSNSNRINKFVLAWGYYFRCNIHFFQFRLKCIHQIKWVEVSDLIDLTATCSN